MPEIMQMAEELGRAISRSPQAAAFRRARQTLEADSEISETLKQYDEQARKIAQLEVENKPVEVDDKHKLQALQNKLTASDLFKKYTATQLEYVDLMRQVNEALRRQLTETEGQE